MARPDTDNHEWTSLYDVTVGDPTKASDMNAVRENQKWIDEAKVLGWKGETYSGVSSDKNGHGMFHCAMVIGKDDSDVLVDASTLGWPNESLSLEDRLLSIQGRWLLVKCEDQEVPNVTGAKFLPGNVWDDGQNEEGDDHGRTLARGTIETSFYSGPGQANYSSSTNWRVSYTNDLFEVVTGSANQDYLYFYVENSTGDLRARWEEAAGAMWAADMVLVLTITTSAFMLHHT